MALAARFKTPGPAADHEPRRVSVLGSTGSVGQNTIALISNEQSAGRAYAIEALTAHTNVALLVEQAKHLSPNVVAIGDENLYGALAETLAGTGIEVTAGEAALTEAAGRPADWVMAAIVGAAGLNPTLAAIRQGATVALANKEVLVCAGDLVMQEVAAGAGTLLPVDSEHNAIFQVFDFDHPETVDRIILTASGGPFREFDRARMASVKPEEAVAHPTWDMGAKISIDSATMMNKGLELIEAHHLFRMPEDRIDILLHPQSVVHSLVSYVDGSVLAQLGAPDMRTPISVTLAWPDRLEFGAERLDLASIASLTFEPTDPDRFPALRLARQALQTGGTAPTILNAANEVAVVEFMARRIGFLDIARVVEETLTELPVAALRSLDDVFETDTVARRTAKRVSGS